MGLDGVELLMRIEEEFSIDLPDDEVSSVRTVGDLYEVVLSKLKTTPDCFSSKAFYRTRRTLVDSLGVPRRSVRPSTYLDTLFPDTSRYQLWNQISTNIGLTIPNLRHSLQWKNRFKILSALITTAFVLTALWPIIHFNLYPANSMVFFLFWFFVWILIFGFSYQALFKLTPFLASELPVTSVGDLARVVLTLNSNIFSQSVECDAKLSRDTVWIKLVEILCDQQGLAPEEIIPNATIVEDLGIC
jgi:acyl carrier protein